MTDDEITVVITKPWLNLAFFDLRGLSTFTDLAPDVQTWMVGGHSLGGVTACQFATVADARGQLPASAEMIEIPGASHASFGACGPQAGDGTPTATPAEVDAVITAQVGALAGALR